MAQTREGSGWPSSRAESMIRLSKWFYDTSTGVAIGAARCGSFVGERFGLLVDSCG
jgi:hypothetical protein